MHSDHSVVDEIIHAEADQLLYRVGLRALIEQYAPVSAVGSYALGLMAWRDLDLAMNAPNISVSDFPGSGQTN